MPRKAPVVLPPPTGERICCFCGLKDDNELDYGKFHEYHGIITHYYCLLFSSNMQQKGLDDEGILGFLPGDINKELRRGRRLACCYCKKTGATLGCCNTKCKKIFHFPCGLKAGSLHQYFGEFRSYCIHHRPKQNIDDRVLKEVSQRESKICYICYDDVNPNDILRTIWAPCCKKNAWFHRTCVQQLAMSAGYFFKCPLCNNKNEFQRAMLDHGIFIPSQDASWELVPNAFQELLYRHNRCDAEKCNCPKGREHTSTNAKWELTLCRTCGSQGIHMACGNLKWGEALWECSECISILHKTVITERSEITTSSRYTNCARVLRSEKVQLTEDDSSSDTDISVGGYPEIPMEATVSSSLTSQTSSYVFRSTINMERQNTPETQQATRIDRSNDKIISSKILRNSIAENHENREIAEQSGNDELPPLTKKPRISESSVDNNHPDNANDSDDDIIVVSGPSRKETSRSLDNPWIFANSTNDKETNARINEKQPQSETTKIHQDDSKIVEHVSRQTMNLFAKTHERLRRIGYNLEIEKPPPIEIDLSDSESTSTTSLTTNINSEHTANVVPDVPELNIQISNVTSLAPEVFANVPEYADQTLNDSAINLQCRGSDNFVDQNYLDCISQQTHEQLQIVRFDGTTETGNSTNSILYGLTIPGTNNTVPLIISSSDNTKSPMATTLQEIWNNSLLQHAQSNINSSLPSALSRLAGPKSRKAAIQAAAIQAAAAVQEAAAMKNSTIRGYDKTIVASPKSSVMTIQSSEKNNTPTNRKNDKSTPFSSKLSYSVPLETVVNDHILMSRPSNKSAANNEVYDNTGSSTNITGNLVKSINTATSTPQANSTMTNSTNSSNPQKSTLPIVSSNNIPPNGIVSSHLTRMYGFIQNDTFSTSQTTSNALASSRISQISNFPVGQAGNFGQNGHGNVNPILTGMNTNWPINGTVGSINLPVANVNSNIPTTGYGATTNVHLQKTSNIDNEMELYIIPSDQNTRVSSENCDGDAGSALADQPTSHIATNTKSDRTVTTSICQLVAATDNRDRSNRNRKFDSENDSQNNGKYVAEKYDSTECSTTTDRDNSTDRAGLMNKTINLRDIKFTIRGSNIVKMTLYETYCVNINVDSGSKRNYASRETSNISTKNSSDLFAERTNGCSLNRGNETLRNVNNDSEGLPGSFTNSSTNSSTVDGNDNDLSNQSSDNLRSNVATADSETLTNELYRTEIRSRGQEELKENLDPVPPFVNLASNAANSNERKTKSRLRSGVNNHTMQRLNELESQETIGDEKERNNCRKLANHDQSFVNGTSKVSYNNWNENACGASRTLVISTDVESDNRKSMTRVRCNDDNDTAEFSDNVETSVKRPRYISDENNRETRERNMIAASNETTSDNITTMCHLVSNAERTQSRKISRVNVCNNEQFCVNSITEERERTSNGRDENGESSVCCKVSIDLARIRTVLANKLSISRKTKNGEFNERARASCFDNRNRRKDIFYTRTFQYDVPKKSRSLGNLAINDHSSLCRFSYVKARRWKSAECLDGLSRQSRYEDSVNGFCNISLGENTRRGYKRKNRSFEKHDCVR